jgi:transposase
MIGATRAVRVFAYAAPIDMRKGFDGLAALATHDLGHDLMRGDAFLFVGRSCHRAKVLYFDGTGLCLLSKRLEKGRFARLWARAEGGSVELTLSELALFLEGNALIGVQRLSPEALCEKDLARSARI